MSRKQRWFGKNRRSFEDRRILNDPNYFGPERRSEEDRRYREKPSLLVVDSSPTYLFYMGMLFKNLEYNVRTATAAEDALKLLADFNPSLIIADTTLPRMSGINMLRHIRQDPRLKSIPLIVHTADNDPAVRTACKVEGCAGFFKKPADPDALYRAIQAATESTPRQTIRIDTTLSVDLDENKPSGGIVRTETATTLSEGGIYIKTPNPEPVNTILPLWITIRNRVVKVTGKVLYSSQKAGKEHKQAGMAVQFVTISPDDKDFIRVFIIEQITKGISLPHK